jgi:hypothetical protein
MATRRDWLIRIGIGGALGMAGCLLLGFLTQPGALFGGSLRLDFTFCYNSQIPEWLGAILAFVAWFAFGAEIAVATLPFSEDGKGLLRRSLLHFGAMLATVGLWAWWNFGAGELLSFLLPLTLVYALVWLGRWVGWMAEADQIRRKLGLAAGPSPLKWRETLPHLGFALVLCMALPLVLRAVDPPDVPVLSGILLPYLLLPVGGFTSGLSLGKRQGFCPLYPTACALLYLPMVFLLFNSSALFHCGMVALPALAGNLTGAWMRRSRERENKP